MLVRFEEVNGWLVARPEFARIDVQTAKGFTSAMTAHCSGRSQVVLDLTDVTFIDSRGLAALVSIFKALSTRGTLRLANLSGQLDVLLTLTRLNTLFPLFGSVDEAINA